MPCWMRRDGDGNHDSNQYDDEAERESTPSNLGASTCPSRSDSTWGIRSRARLGLGRCGLRRSRPLRPIVDQGEGSSFVAGSISTIIFVRHNTIVLVFAEFGEAVDAGRERVLTIRAPVSLTGRTVRIEPYGDMNVHR